MYQSITDLNLNIDFTTFITSHVSLTHYHNISGVLEHFHSSWRLGQSFKPLEGVIDEDTVLVRLTTLAGRGG